MRLDIRMPIGIMFVVLGLILAVYGIVSDKAIYQRSLSININLWWGLMLLAFGGVMVWLARRNTSQIRPTSESPEGRAIEARERRTGLEKEPPRRGGH